MGDTTILLTVLGAVFGFIFLVFVLMVSCFTWRRRRQHRGLRAGHDRIVEARLAARMKEFPKSSSTRQDRWTHSSKHQDMAGVDEEGRQRLKQDESEDKLEVDESPFSDEQANSAEWGATVNEDGTRSYLNGW